MKKIVFCLSAILFLSCILNVVINKVSAQESDNKILKSLRWRPIGPYRGGRVATVSGVTSDINTYYFGATGGGVWKTTDAGVNWQAITDGQIGTGSVGAVAVSETDPNVIYLGMGERTVRGNVSHGDGIYKSTDAGTTWKHTGLRDSRHIFRIRIHPRDPNIVYVAALGHLFGQNEERGIFRSTDGGKTWQKILYRDDKTGATDLIIDPVNASILYAGLWQVKRTPYSLESGGEGSGLFKSTDSGDTWTELTKNKGLPKTVIGNIGITVSPANHDRVWAIIEAEEGGVFRSDDAGKTWTRINEDRNLRQRAWYYSRIYADPKNIDTVYVLNVNFHKSNDGGRTFTTINVPHGDNHDLWIAPNDPLRMIYGDDGGAAVSFNGGKTWTEQDQATAQFYRVAVDNDFPYNIYGGQQDNSTVRIPSRTTGFGIDRRNWYAVGGGESGWIAPHPKDSKIVFAGSYDGLLTRYDHNTGQTRDVTVWPDNPMGYGAESLKYRFQWNYPILFSPHDSNVLYAAGNILFKSTNEGQNWEAISPDLTRDDKSRQKPSGGPITKDNTSVEYYCTIFTVMESLLQKDLIWAGTDDGLVQVTRDGGKNWQNVTPKDMPEWMQINSIEASPHTASTAYFAGTKYKSDDFRPYLYKTTDYGKSWKKIVNGIPEQAFTRVIREDPNRQGLLYAGTELGMFVSFDDGNNWQPLQMNLPVVPITDLAVHKREKDLIAATQGRSFWILDDLTVLHQMADNISKEDVYLFKPEDAYRMPGFGTELPPTVTVGENPANGAVIYFHLKNKIEPSTKTKLEFFDSNGALLKTFLGKEKDSETKKDESSSSERKDTFTYETGLNRFVWNFRIENATTFPGMILWSGETRGPRVIPGNYQVKLTVGDKTLTQNFEIKKDPRLSLTQEDFLKQYDFLVKVRDKLTETNESIVQIREIKKQIDDVSSRFKDQAEAKNIVDLAKSLKEKLTAIEEELYQTKNRSSQDPLNFPIKLNNKLAALGDSVGDSDYPPTSQAYAVYQDVTAKIDVQLQKLKEALNTDLTQFNQAVKERNTPAIILRNQK
ncbi:MAG: glycosyl hydrolase [Acidobacteria bacterium]|nr:glycosyl hydrolase [Acidobacteriota bacterium]